MAAPAEERIVLLGKTGSGKSSVGNVILGENKFEVSPDSNSVTKDCKTEEVNRNNMKIRVTDTPGIFDTDRPNEDLKYSIISCLTELVPGSHAFILVLKVGRYTQEEKESVKMILKWFGNEALKYTVVIFTHGDELEVNQTIEEYVERNKDLKELVDKCGGRVYVTDCKYWGPTSSGGNLNESEYRSNRFQINQVLTTINTMLRENGGSYYTNESLQVIAQAVQDEENKIRLERKNEICNETRNRVQTNMNSDHTPDELNEVILDREIEQEIHREAIKRIKNKLLKSKKVGVAVGSLLGLLFGVSVGTALPFVTLAGLLTAGVKSIEGTSKKNEVDAGNIIDEGVVAGLAAAGVLVTNAAGIAAAAGESAETAETDRMVEAAAMYAIAGGVAGAIVGSEAGGLCVDTNQAVKESAKAVIQAGMSTVKAVWDTTQKLARSKESAYRKDQ